MKTVSLSLPLSLSASLYVSPSLCKYLIFHEAASKLACLERLQRKSQGKVNVTGGGRMKVREEPESMLNKDGSCLHFFQPMLSFTCGSRFCTCAGDPSSYQNFACSHAR